MENDKLQQFLGPIFILMGCVLMIFFGGQNIYSNVQECLQSKKTLEETTQKVADAQAKLDGFKKQEAEEAQKAQEEANNSKDLKPFYKPVVTGLDTEGIIGGEFTEILELVRANKIKVRSIKYDYNPQDDNFVKNASEKYNVARLNMEMVANYLDYDNFLKELYKHEHFLDMQSVEIVPYRKNKSILLVNFKLKLYAKK